MTLVSVYVAVIGLLAYPLAWWNGTRYQRDTMLPGKDQAWKYYSKSFFRQSNQIMLLRTESKRSCKNFLASYWWSLATAHPWTSVVYCHCGDYINSSRRLVILVCTLTFAAAVCDVLLYYIPELYVAVFGALAAFPLPSVLYSLFRRRIPKIFQLQIEGPDSCIGKAGMWWFYGYVRNYQRNSMSGEEVVDIMSSSENVGVERKSHRPGGLSTSSSPRDSHNTLLTSRSKGKIQMKSLNIPQSSSSSRPRTGVSAVDQLLSRQNHSRPEIAVMSQGELDAEDVPISQRGDNTQARLPHVSSPQVQVAWGQNSQLQSHSLKLNDKGSYYEKRDSLYLAFESDLSIHAIEGTYASQDTFYSLFCVAMTAGFAFVPAMVLDSEADERDVVLYTLLAFVVDFMLRWLALLLEEAIWMLPKCKLCCCCCCCVCVCLSPFSFFALARKPEPTPDSADVFLCVLVV
mmetsp:Transcript_23251/g.41138  ORF Transcript_23251/g.41138 Transcript_23251/m.41138 type:complete len:459 (+) Transcript_23251:187-1563(+)